jgi:glycosyltransferase involved in cell wall biosynthesis
MSDAEGNTPTISFGLPVCNEKDAIRRCLDSILRQDFFDLEVVVCDNGSTDGTREILKSYASRDPRVRVFLNTENIGQIANFNRVFELARGKYFRWIGGHDWIEPACASACIAALEAEPRAIAATMDFTIETDLGYTKCEVFRGERLESEFPSRRLSRLLWFFHAGDGLYDVTIAHLPFKSVF